MSLVGCGLYLAQYDGETGLSRRPQAALRTACDCIDSVIPMSRGSIWRLCARSHRAPADYLQGPEPRDSDCPAAGTCGMLADVDTGGVVAAVGIASDLGGQAL